MSASAETSRKSVKLTKRVVDGLTYEGTGNGACYVWDSEVKGFGIRIYTGRQESVLSHLPSGNPKAFPDPGDTRIGLDG